MIVTMSRQDLQGVVEYAKNAIIQRLVTKYDVQSASNNARDDVLSDLQNIRRENQPVLKQTLAYCEQLSRRSQNIEARISVMEQDVRTMVQTMNRMLGQQAQATNGLQRF